MERKGKGSKDVMPVDHIETRIFVIRGKRVIIDSDLADLYGVTTKRLNEQVKRNKERFPEDFSFRLNNQEVNNLRSQYATSSTGVRVHGGRRNAPLVFTEHGAIMAASVLNTQRAVEVSLYVVRAFIKLREFSASHKELCIQIDELERKVTGHDRAISELINAIRKLMEPPADTKKRSIGFAPWKEE